MIDVQAVISEALAEREAGRLGAAAERLARAQAEAPEAVEIPAHLGDVQLAMGNPGAAANAFRAALELSPQAAVLHTGLAAALEQRGDFSGAADAYARAAHADPGNAAVHNNLGLMLRRTGRLGEAVGALETAVELVPDKAAYHANLARVLQDKGDLARARAAAQQAVHLAPDSADALVNLGCILRDLRLADLSADALERATRLAPDMMEAWLNYGLALRDAGRLEDAIEAVEVLRESHPDLAEGHANLAQLYLTAGRFDDAEKSFEEALARRPDHPDTLAAQAVLFIDSHRGELAERSCRKALAADPDCVPALTNLANLDTKLGNYGEAVSLLERAADIEPENVDVRRNIADPLFMSGNLQAAWAAYEYRWQKPNRPRRPHEQREWTGQDLSNRTILVWSEQGIGDTFCFSTCLADGVAAAGSVIFEVDERLVSLYGRSFPDLKVVPRLDPPHPDTADPNIDFQCPLGNFAKVFRPDLSSFPEAPTYLRPQSERVDHWRRRFPRKPGAINIGFFWRSGSDPREHIRAYPPIDEWTPVFDVGNTEFVSLQYGVIAVSCQDHSGIAQSPQVFERMETRNSESAGCADEFSVRNGAEGLGAILDDRQSVFVRHRGDSVQIRRYAGKVNRKDGFGVPGYRVTDPCGIQVQAFIDVHENGRGADQRNAGRCRQVRHRAGNDLVTRPDARRPKTQHQGIGPVAHPDGMGRAHIFDDIRLERLEFIAQDERTARDDPFKVLL